MWPAEPYRAYPRRLDQVVLALTVVVLAGLGAASDGALGLVFAVLAASVAASLAAYAVMEMCGPPG